MHQSCVNSNDFSKAMGPTEVNVSYKLQSQDPLKLDYTYGFELGCGNGTAGASQCTATAVNGENVQVEFADCPSPLSPVSI